MTTFFQTIIYTCRKEISLSTTITNSVNDTPSITPSQKPTQATKYELIDININT